MNNFNWDNQFYQSNFFDIICDCTSLQYDSENSYYKNLEIIFSKLKKKGLFVGKILYSNKNMNPKNLLLNNITYKKLKISLNLFSKNEIQKLIFKSEDLNYVSKFFLIYAIKR